MPAPRLLVMEGNSPEARAQHVAAGGSVASKGYAELLQELMPDAVVDICFPGDPGANLPNGEALEGYDGVAITGSGLHVYEASPPVTRQSSAVSTGSVSPSQTTIDGQIPRSLMTSTASPSCSSKLSAFQRTPAR